MSAQIQKTEKNYLNSNTKMKNSNQKIKWTQENFLIFVLGGNNLIEGREAISGREIK